MSEYKKQQISSLMDDESMHESSDVIHELGSHDELRHTWLRYHLIGDCLRGNLPEKVDLKLAERIGQAITAEPSILAPGRHTTYMKPVLGFAIAASVAMVAIMGLQHTNTDPSFSIPSQPIALQQSVSSNQQVAGNYTKQGNRQQVQPVQHIPASTQINAGSRLNRYLVNYNEYRANAGMQGILPYVRIISYETEEQE